MKRLLVLALALVLVGCSTDHRPKRLTIDGKEPFAIACNGVAIVAEGNAYGVRFTDSNHRTVELHGVRTVDVEPLGSAIEPLCQ